MTPSRGRAQDKRGYSEEGSRAGSVTRGEQNLRRRLPEGLLGTPSVAAASEKSAAAEPGLAESLVAAMASHSAALVEAMKNLASSSHKPKLNSTIRVNPTIT